MRERVNAAVVCPILFGVGVFSAMGAVTPMSAFYQGRLFAGTLLGLVPAIVLTPIWVGWVENRVKERSFWLTLVASAGLPMLAVACILFALSLLPSVPNRMGWGPRTDFSGIRSLVPLALLGTLTYVLIQCRSSRRRRVGNALLWLLLAAAATQCWVLARSFVDRSLLADLWHWDDAALRWKLPAVIVLALAGATLGLVTRLGARLRRMRFAPIVPYLAAVGVFFWPVRYPATWAKEDIGTLLAAYANPEGDLILHVRAARARALGTTLSAVLIRPHGQDGFRAVSTLPVFADAWGPIFSPDLHCVDLRTAVPLLDRTWGGYLRSTWLDVSSGAVLESSTDKLQAPFDWHRRALGPGRSWFNTDSDSSKGIISVGGATTHGDRFFDQRNDCVWAGQGGWFDGNTFHMLAHTFPRAARRGVNWSSVTWFVTLDLEQGHLSMKRLAPDGFGVIAGISPDGRRFVASSSTYPQGRLPCVTYRLFETSGESRVLGAPCRDEAFKPVWLEVGDPLLLPACQVITAMAEATLQDPSYAPGLLPDAREIGGRIFIEQGSRYERKKVALLELARDGMHACALAAGPVSVQWLPDSILWCEQTATGGRVIRFHPSEDTYEVLLAIP